MWLIYRARTDWLGPSLWSIFNTRRKICCSHIVGIVRGRQTVVHPLFVHHGPTMNDRKALVHKTKPQRRRSLCGLYSSAVGSLCFHVYAKKPNRSEWHCKVTKLGCHGMWAQQQSTLCLVMQRKKIINKIPTQRRPPANPSPVYSLCGWCLSSSSSSIALFSSSSPDGLRSHVFCFLYISHLVFDFLHICRSDGPPGVQVAQLFVNSTHQHTVCCVPHTHTSHKHSSCVEERRSQLQ